jgi:hypothetical protein
MNEFVAQFLSFLETRETRLLSWGFYDVSFTPTEIQTLLANEAEQELQDEWAQLCAAGWTLDNLLDDMEQANLLYMVRQNPRAYRTRFAESVRLIGRLRQTFREDQWATAPNLVSDIKLHLKSRHYPRRDQSAATCWNAVRAHCTQSQLQQNLFDALASDQGGIPLDFAAFQMRAFAHILGQYNARDVTGSVVSAGTGAGKTKAFYVPAFLGACTELAGPAFTKIVAIYPRNVLLADQFREAIAESLKLRPVLQGAGLRQLTFGALLGNTPWQNAFDGRRNGRRRVETDHGWSRVGNGFIVPFLKSPLAPEEELIWRDTDRQAGRTCLYRANGNPAQPDVPDGVIRLTRDDLMDNPPDVLFLSVEMLNREMGNPRWARTFGLGQGARAPRLLLLDEIHAYEGIQGAQVAWILRRWRYAIRTRNLHVVGLSATLKEATAHLARVAAIRQENVHEFRPLVDELEHESIEYNLAVKGDPAAGTSLLSTSIQCGMVLARTLTPRGQLPTPPQLPIQPERFFARKLFGFTDNLDVVNRWLTDMSDAEQNRQLASHRLHPIHQNPQPTPMPSPAEIAQRDMLGQIWELPRRLGHNLNQPLLVRRCSSQDPGADANADLVIATSALEVGFDDPLVGAVLQHKRPLSIASFIQRKGRAGRQRGTRPWTLVVLSDYGADRWMFQQAERLFEPELEELRLPFHNPYVLRIHSTYFLIDWIGRRIGRDSPFDYLRRPVNNQARQRAIAILEDFLVMGNEWQAFRRELMGLFTSALSGPGSRLTAAQVDGLVWELPRPLLRHVVPCLLRKLESQWTVANPPSPDFREDAGITYPLPEFLPKATFANLDVAEARLSLRPRGAPQRDEFLDVTQALTESCPGRVSKRYSTGVGEVGYWHSRSPNLPQGPSSASVQQLFPQSFELCTVGATRVFQPESVTLDHRAINILDSSYGAWDWQSLFRPFGQGHALPVFSVEPWNDVVDAVDAFLHRDQSGIDVIRYAESCDYEIRQSRQQNGTVGCLSLGTQDDTGAVHPEAIGFQRRVDGIRVRLNADHLRTLPTLGPALEARFRSDFYLHRMQTTDRFPDTVNPFLAGWLWQSSLAMLTATAVTRNCTLQVAQTHLHGMRDQEGDRVITNIFHVRDPNLLDQEGRLTRTLHEHWRDPNVVAVITDLECTLWSPPAAEYEEWIRHRYVATLAQAFRTAAITAEMDITEDDLSVDVVWNDDGTADIYLTETSSGGLGQVENIVQRLCSEPQRFHHGMRHVMSSCPRDNTTEYLLAVLAQALGDPHHQPLPSAFRSVRQSRGFRELEQAKNALRAALGNEGFETARANIVSIVTRLLRPGSSEGTDRFTHFLNRLWHVTEERLGAGIDSRVFAYYAINRDSISRRLTDHFQQVSGGTTPTDPQLHATVDQLLLPPCKDSCPECLDHRNRYNDFGRPSRELALRWLGMHSPELSVDENPNTWLQLCRDELQHRGMVTLSVSQAVLPNVAQALPELFAEDLEVDILFYSTSIQRIEKVGMDWRITLQLKDLVYA